MTTRFGIPVGSSVATGISGVGTTFPSFRPGAIVRDELMWRWKQQFLKRPFALRRDSGRFAAYTVLLPEEWSPGQGTCFPIGQVHHLVMARRINHGAGAATRFGRRLPFWVPLLALSAHVAPTGPHPIVIGGTTGLRAQYDLAHPPSRRAGGGLVLPRACGRLLGAALDLEDRLVDAALGLATASEPPRLPTYYAAFARRPEDSTRVGAEVVEETRAATDLALETLAGGGVLPETLTSPGGTVVEVGEEEGWRVVSFLTSGEASPRLVHRFLPPSALLEPYVAPGASVECGARIAYYATPRRYPSWRAVKEAVLGEAAADVLAEVVKALDLAHGEYVLRDVRLCPRAVRERRHVNIYEDVGELVGPDGTALAWACPYGALFTEFAQNGAAFRADVWRQQGSSSPHSSLAPAPPFSKCSN